MKIFPFKEVVAKAEKILAFSGGQAEIPASVY
jgi:hypothetical protein